MTKMLPLPLMQFSPAARATLSTAVTAAGLLVVWMLALAVLQLTARDYADPLLAGF